MLPIEVRKEVTVISFLQGELASARRGERPRITINVNGVGYCARVSERMATQLPAVGQPIQVFTHLAVRDTEMLLYGFETAAERDLFGELIGVSGVGPSLALALLGTLSLEDLVRAVVTENIRILSLTPGVGKKTAQRLVLELKTRLSAWRTSQDVSISTTALPANAFAEVEMALLALGYSPTEAVQALQAIGQADNDPGSSVEDYLRMAIAFLSQS